MTTLLQTYDALAAVTLQFDGEDVSVRSLATLKNSIHTADLPIRLLMPITQPATGSYGWRPLDAGGNYAMRALLPDILLIRPAARGVGISEIAREIVTYVDDYTATVPNTLKSASVRVTNVRANPQILEYPIGGQTLYVAVVCSVELEIIA